MISKFFGDIAKKVSAVIGSPWAFAVALSGLLIWALSGFLIGFNDTWQLIVNTSTTIITFLTVFLIQHTQNTSDKATQLKLDELIHSIKAARNDFIDLEDVSEEDLSKLREVYKKYRKNSVLTGLKGKKK